MQKNSKTIFAAMISLFIVVILLLVVIVFLLAQKDDHEIESLMPTDITVTIDQSNMNSEDNNLSKESDNELSYDRENVFYKGADIPISSTEINISNMANSSNNGFGRLTIDVNHPNVYLTNPDTSVYMQYDVYDGNDQLIYSSYLISPGKMEK